MPAKNNAPSINEKGFSNMNSSFSAANSFQEFVLQSSSDNFKTALSNFSYPELAQCPFLLQTASASESKEKLEIFLKILDLPETPENLSKFFTSDQFLGFLDLLNQYPAYEHSLPSLLIGLPPAVFSQALHTINDQQLNLLKHESLLEPIHYHLTQIVHQGEALHEKTEQACRSLEEEFGTIKQEDLTSEQLNQLLNRIEELRDPLTSYLRGINRALSIVWHTDRIDLIEKLSTTKESIHYQLAHAIGKSSSEQHPSTGLYAVMEGVFANIYDASLKESDAAVEGLTRLSIWYLKNYWEMGLLPTIDDPAKLALDPSNFSEAECRQHHQHLFHLVQEQLNRLKIGTVGALKRARIYSKPLLKAYIATHRYLLLS